ncbi:MAG: glycosyltransferase [Planctomycetota bacterium]
MKILHVITTLDVGGAEMHLLAQVRGQCARGHVVHVAYLKGRGTLAPDFRAAGARSVECLGSSATLLPRLMGRMRDVDLTHSHLLKADMACALAALLCGRRKRLIASKHNDEQVLKRALVSRVHGLLGNVPARTIVLSDHVGRFIGEHGRVRRDKIVRIYYGLDPTPFEAAARMPSSERDALRASFGFAPGDLVFTCVARFAPQKAHDVLIRAFARALEQVGTLRLLLVGDDPFGDGREQAEAVARALPVGDRVVFAGIRRDVPALLAASDVFVMSSLWEGLGLVFLESMATGVPVLSTQVSAIPEVVTEGVTGRLVPPSDVEALAAAMVAFANDRDARVRMGRAGTSVVRERFGLDRMIEETLCVYGDVLGAGPRAAP